MTPCAGWPPVRVRPLAFLVGTAGTLDTAQRNLGLFVPKTLAQTGTVVGTAPILSAVPTSENALGTAKASKSLDVPGVPAVPPENAKGGNAARSAAVPTQPDEPGLSLYSLRELDRWYEEHRNRRTGLDQDPLVRDLLHRLAEPGLCPYTIRDLAHWYEEEANRRRVGFNIDQDALDRDPSWPSWRIPGVHINRVRARDEGRLSRQRP